MWLVVPVLFFGTVRSISENDYLGNNEIKIEHYVYWPNATIPFYIDPEHYDHEQSNTILMALSNFSFKTCLKFQPALVKPQGDQHVMLFQNPNGVRQCVFSTTGHPRDEPHTVVLGYNCLQSPKIDMMLMKALGFSFEHNRAIRNHYISVQKENIDPSAMDLFTMDDKLPMELRALPYDVNSVMHFDERDFSKNGHRTIVILDHKVKQNRVGLSDIDLRKLNIVYSPECRKRDRQEKIDLCQGFPGVARRKRSLDQLVRKKRDVDPLEIKSLRVNPDITPPPELINNSAKDVDKIIEDLGIKDGVEEITSLVFKVGALALNNTRKKYCNNTDNSTEVRSTVLARRSDDKKPDILGVVENVADFVKDMVDHALSNLTLFCETETDFRAYQRARCPFYSGGGGGGTCWGNYRSTKHGPVMYSTQHRPWIVQSTKHEGMRGKRILYHDRRQGEEGKYGESGRKAELKPEVDVRKKRDVQDVNMEREAQRFEGRRYNARTRDQGRWDDSGLTTERYMKQRRASEEVKSYETDDGPRDEKNKEELRPVKKEADVEGSKGLVPRTVELSKKNKEFYNERIWPYGVVRYIITQDETFDLDDLRRRLEAVKRILKERTCVRLEEITEDDADRFEDYLVLDGSADYITGRVGGRQNFGSLELFEGGQHKQHTAMMVMAMLGFYFELARHDRDAHVRVHMRHVRPDKLHHFEKIRSDATLPLPYDYESATHPAWQFWRKLGRTGISSVATFKEKDPDGSIMRTLGQHDQLLSDLDIVKINSVYGVKCFMETKRDKHKANQDSEGDRGRNKYNDRHRDRDTENRDHVKHKEKHHRIITEDRDEEKDKYDGRNQERHRDRHVSKYKERDIDISDERGDRNDRDRHRRPDYESDEDREEMKRIGVNGKGNKDQVFKQSREKHYKLKERHSAKDRDWDVEEKSDVNEDRYYKDKYEEVRPGVMTKHGGIKGRHKIRDDTEDRSGRHERGDYGRNKYNDERSKIDDRFAPNRYQIKDREESERNRQREKEVIDRDSLETEESRNRGRGRHRNAREKDREEPDIHSLRYPERHDSGFNIGHLIGRYMGGYSGGHPISQEQKEGLSKKELMGTEIQWKAENNLHIPLDNPTVATQPKRFRVGE